MSMHIIKGAKSEGQTNSPCHRASGLRQLVLLPQGFRRHETRGLASLHVFPVLAREHRQWLLSHRLGTPAYIQADTTLRTYTPDTQKIPGPFIFSKALSRIAALTHDNAVVGSIQDSAGTCQRRNEAERGDHGNPKTMKKMKTIDSRRFLLYTDSW